MISKLVVVDGTNLFWRAYHGLLKQSFEKDGKPTFGVYGTINTIATAFRSHLPTHAVVVFDWGKSSYRLAIWPKYKAGRPTSEIVDHVDAESQMEVVQRILPQMGLQTWREENVEADDVIASFVGRFKDEVDEVMVISGDKDMRQLAYKNVAVVHPSIGNRPEVVWDAKAVLDHYGVPADRLPEVWALSGDKVDNIPGVPGIGEKTAIKLIQKYGDLSHVALSDEKKIEGYRHDINMSYRLVKLNPELTEFPYELEHIRFEPVAPIEKRAKILLGSLNELGFDSLVSRWMDGTLWYNRGVRLRDLKSKNQ